MSGNIDVNTLLPPPGYFNPAIDGVVCYRLASGAAVEFFTGPPPWWFGTWNGSQFVFAISGSNSVFSVGSGVFVVPGLPTVDPHSANRVWRNGDFLCISSG